MPARTARIVETCIQSLVALFASRQLARPHVFDPRADLTADHTPARPPCIRRSARSLPERWEIQVDVFKGRRGKRGVWIANEVPALVSDRNRRGRT